MYRADSNRHGRRTQARRHQGKVEDFGVDRARPHRAIFCVAEFLQLEKMAPSVHRQPHGITRAEAQFARRQDERSAFATGPKILQPDFRAAGRVAVVRDNRKIGMRTAR